MTYDGVILLKSQGLEPQFDEQSVQTCFVPVVALDIIDVSM